MLRLLELVDDESFETWMSAERQMILHTALEAQQRVDATASDRHTPDWVLENAKPFHTAVAAFTNNLRVWRIRPDDRAGLEKVAIQIEKHLRARDAWRDREVFSEGDSGYETLDA